MAIRTERLALPALLIASLLIIFPVLDSGSNLAMESLQPPMAIRGRRPFQSGPDDPAPGSAHIDGDGKARWAPADPDAGRGFVPLLGRDMPGHRRLFGLDAPDMRELVVDEAQPAFQKSSAVALGKYVIVAVIAGLLGRAGVREAREARNRSSASSGERAQMVYKARGEGQEEAGEGQGAGRQRAGVSYWPFPVSPGGEVDSSSGFPV